MADNKSCEETFSYECAWCRCKIQTIKRRIDGTRCPYCGGNLNRIEKKVSIANVKLDLSDSIKELKAIQREAKKATAALKELESIQTRESNPLLSIEIESLDNVPKVIYKGEEITGKTNIDFTWETKTLDPGKVEFMVKYYDKDETGSLTHMVIGEGRKV
ncbi:hypothetical protein [Psychrobacillus sp.]|uniref:hypothetical protein n=1 Tax=Psychrobacillus sp. TaxID=1871623 RepID=UPI0028BE8500|nr:hypothetical protein [Psychrobacillus sp.]